MASTWNSSRDRKIFSSQGSPWLRWTAMSARKFILKVGRNQLPCNSYLLTLVLEKHRHVLKPCALFCFLLPLHPCPPRTVALKLPYPLLFGRIPLVFSVSLFLHHLICPSPCWSPSSGHTCDKGVEEPRSMLRLGWLAGQCVLFPPPAEPSQT